jgi:hypothetical protein
LPVSASSHGRLSSPRAHTRRGSTSSFKSLPSRAYCAAQRAPLSLAPPPPRPPHLPPCPSSASACRRASPRPPERRAHQRVAVGALCCRRC